MPRKTANPAAPSVFPTERDLHSTPLISLQGLLKLWPGSYAVLLGRYKTELGMPGSVSHGKYSVYALMTWLWNRCAQIDAELATARAEGKTSKSAERMEAIKLERAEIDLAREKKLYVKLQDYVDAEISRIQIAVATLKTVPDRMISEGILADSDRLRAEALMREVVSIIQKQIIEGEASA